MGAEAALAHVDRAGALVERFGVTRERIRQIESKTLSKLKSYRDTQKLEAYIR